MHHPDDTSMAAVLIFDVSPNMTTDTAKLVIFLSADFWQQSDFKLRSVTFFFLLLSNIFVNETWLWYCKLRWAIHGNTEQ